MRLKLIIAIIFTILLNACNCFKNDNNFEVSFPEKFDPVVTNSNIICDWGGKNSIVLYDTSLKKILYLYDFKPCGSEAMTKGICGDNIFVQLDGEKNGNIKGIVIKINIPTGEVKTIDFYDDMPGVISIADKQVLIDSCKSYSSADHKLLIYDTLTDSSKIINCPDPIYSRYGANIDGNWYIPIGGRTGENSRLVNMKTRQMINFTDLVAEKFTDSTAYFFASNSSGNIYFEIWGVENGVNSGEYIDCLYRLDSLNPVSSMKIIKIVMNKPLRIMDAVEYNNSLYVLFTKSGENILPQTFLIQKYLLNDYSLQAEKEIPEGSNTISVRNGSIWMLRFKRDAACQMYEINPDTLEYTLR